MNERKRKTLSEEKSRKAWKIPGKICHRVKEGNILSIRTSTKEVKNSFSDWLRA